ncbi:MAG: alanine--tRNA ligase [Planctomycetes bacterium]|nr:alanine--tRNA ligase [Planctomycetota bacterium]
MTQTPSQMSSEPSVKSAARVRAEFLEFFQARGHRFVPSSPVFPQDDPTLLFTNAGMNQFKDVFLGFGKRDYTRAVNTQKCIRVSGKHNDLEEVGLDTYHHTFFEMLGNWSFGDYFKQDAITWSWELLTKVWGLPRERLWVTVFGGDVKDGLPADDEAERIWRENTDIDPTHILRFDRKANFWEMGETGPCGPCTEIHIDRGAPGSDPRDGADPKLGVNAGNERFIELWNNVFMQFNRQDDGSLAPLPAKHVDTGMGLERVVAVIQGKRSNYDTDLFTPIFRALERRTGKRYGDDEKVDIAFRVIADHLRAVSAAFADGALPSNEGRGYMLRRLLRRAARFGRQTIGLREPFLFDVVPAVGEVLGPAFPNIRQREAHIQLLVRAEEESFGVTLDRGLVLFADLAGRLEKSGKKELAGSEAYDLYATYGFPQDLVEQMLRERGWSLERASWSAAEEKHKNASRAEGTFKQLLSAEQVAGLSATTSTYHDVGAANAELDTRVVRLFQNPGQKDRLILERSPFYPEGGGQVGDAGRIATADGTFVFDVEDTKKTGDVVVHVGASRGAAREGLAVRATVDVERRNATRANHTATHLMHKALREVLGEHVTQQGSYVGPDRLRFDLSHPKAITAEELERIERLVNREIARNQPLTTTVEELNAAKARGVMALFSEKYADRVRVVAVGGFSAELCGGTHVAAAGDIGTFVIASERALQAGVRRIEALTRDRAVEHVQAQRRTLDGAARALKTNPEELAGRIEQLQKEVKELKKKGEKSAVLDVGSAFDTLKSARVQRGDVHCTVLDFPELDTAALRDLGDRARSLGADQAVVLFGRADGRVPFLIVFEGASLKKGLKAGELAGKISAVLGGGGGGKPTLAQGQGLSPDKVGEALAVAEAYLTTALG